MSALSSTKLSPWGAWGEFVTSANLMRRAELGQRWLTAYETHSLTDLMRPLFHTNSWFFLHLSHTNVFPSSYMGDLRICIKVQLVRRWFVSARRLWMTEWQKCQFWRSVIWIYEILVCLSILSKSTFTAVRALTGPIIEYWVKIWCDDWMCHTLIYQSGQVLTMSNAFTLLKKSLFVNAKTALGSSRVVLCLELFFSLKIHF